jgi:hypothetical protein
VITGLVVHWWASFVVFIGGLVTVPAPPAFLGQLAGWVTTARSYVASTDVWLPWPLAVAVLAAYAGSLLAGLAVKLVRIIASFLTLGGGSAA